MPPVTVPDEVVEDADPKLAAEVDAAFLSGFSGEPVTPTGSETPPAETETPTDAEKVAEEPKAKEAATLVVAPSPQITPEHVREAIDKASADVRGSVEKVARDTGGKIGSLEKMLKDLQANTPVGKPIVVKAEDLSVTTDYPEVGKKLADDLTKIFSQFKGTAEATPAETPEEFETRVNAVADKRISDREAARELKRVETENTARAESVKTLTKQHPDWNEIIGAPASKTEFRTWLGTLDSDYESEILNTWDAGKLSRAIVKFKADQAKKVPAPKTDRKERLKEAITPKGGAPAPAEAGEETVEEAFKKGFETGRN